MKRRPTSGKQLLPDWYQFLWLRSCERSPSKRPSSLPGDAAAPTARSMGLGRVPHLMSSSLVLALQLVFLIRWSFYFFSVLSVRRHKQSGTISGQPFACVRARHPRQNFPTRVNVASVETSLGVDYFFSSFNPRRSCQPGASPLRNSLVSVCALEY